MYRRVLAAAALLVAAVPGHALANGRPPQTINLHFRPGHPDDILIAATFGALFSHDGGATWTWMCETAVGYGGTYDPDYAVSAGGAVFATTFDGLQIMTDGCSFARPAAFGETFAAQVAEGPDGRVHVAISDKGDKFTQPPTPPDYKIYRSDNDGAAWDAGLAVGPGGESWTSFEVAPSDPDRLYLTGYRLDGPDEKDLLVFRSDDGGDSYQPLAVTPFAVTGRSDLQIAAISPTDPDRVLMRVTFWNPSGVVGDAFYLTTTGGDAWTHVLDLNDNAPGVVFRTSGDAVIGTNRSGIHRSTTGGASFELLPEPQPDVYCMREAPGGALWACTNNYDVAPLDAGVMSTTDLATWTSVMGFEEDILAPVDCASGTIQQDCCSVRVAACPVELTPEWCFLRAQLGILADPIDCPAVAPDAAPGSEGPPPPGSCCGAGAQPAATSLAVVLVGLAIGRRRRRRTPL
jgi:uncharacterized protein (TIGR03382 family)